jgi:hypothetical protein
MLNDIMGVLQSTIWSMEKSFGHHGAYFSFDVKRFFGKQLYPLQGFGQEQKTPAL